MKMLVLGAGRMGLGAVHDLAAQKDVTEVTVADADASRARQVADRVKGKVRPVHLDVTDHTALIG
ncbi:MAG TPA: saccharopine dehydrogenase NADP-binding domain-containing protein, partial [Thermoanaerobaculia bacterium]